MSKQTTNPYEDFMRFIDAYTKATKAFSINVEQINNAFLDYNERLLKISLNTARGIQELEKNVDNISLNKSAKAAIEKAKKEAKITASKTNKALALVKEETSSEAIPAAIPHSDYNNLKDIMIRSTAMMWVSLGQALNQMYPMTIAATNRAIIEIYDAADEDMSSNATPAKTSRAKKNS